MCHSSANTCKVISGSNTSNIFKSGSIYFTCNDSKWTPSGCVINGELVPEGQMFKTQPQNYASYFGRCRKTQSLFVNGSRESVWFLPQLEGCVDTYGNMIQPGKRFLVTQLLWATCKIRQIDPNDGSSSGKQLFQEVFYDVDGCYNGTDSVVRDGQDFVYFQNVFNVTGNEWPYAINTMSYENFCAYYIFFN